MRKRRLIERLWREDLRWYETALWMPLAPAAAVYAAVLAMRSAYWNVMRRRADVRTISVGGLTVGGSSKTPFTLLVAGKLAERGLKVAIVSRGWGGRPPGGRAAMVSERGRILLTPEQAGDEPIMMARRFQGPIAVARRRIDAIRLLERHGRLDAVVLDDAFQHIRLARDFDLLVVNTDRAFGNGWLLPAGPMRERLGAVRRADAIVLVGRDDGPAAELKVSGTRVFRAATRPRSLVHPEFGQWREVPLAIHGRRVLALSGLADPNAFYEMIRAQDADLVGVLEYPDHYRYTQADWQNIASAARNADMVITTEKDLVKLERFPFARDSLYALRLEVTMDEQESARLLEMIAGAAQTPRQAALA